MDGGGGRVYVEGSLAVVVVVVLGVGFRYRFRCRSRIWDRGSRVRGCGRYRSRVSSRYRGRLRVGLGLRVG